MRLEPTVSAQPLLIAHQAAVGGVPSVSPAPQISQARAERLLFEVQQRVTQQTLELGASPESRREYLERLETERQAKLVEAKARQRGAMAEARAEEKERQEAAREDHQSGRIRLAYTASELREMYETAVRLNIQV